MFTGILYDQMIQAKTISDLKRKASIIANGRNKPVDQMEVTADNGLSCRFVRFNQVCPNNTIIRGKWQ
jgi:hypothetical protein